MTLVEREKEKLVIICNLCFSLISVVVVNLKIWYVTENYTNVNNFLNINFSNKQFQKDKPPTVTV